MVGHRVLIVLCVFLKFQSLTNDFLSIFRLLDVYDFVFHLLLRFFKLGHDVLLCKIFWTSSWYQTSFI